MILLGGPRPAVEAPVAPSFWLTTGVKLRGPEGAQRLRATSASTSEFGGAVGSLPPRALRLGQQRRTIEIVDGLQGTSEHPFPEASLLDPSDRVRAPLHGNLHGFERDQTVVVEQQRPR